MLPAPAVMDRPNGADMNIEFFSDRASGFFKAQYASGTDSTRPSINSTVKVSTVVSMRLILRSEKLIPFVQDQCFVFFNNFGNLPQIIRSKCEFGYFDNGLPISTS